MISPFQPGQERIKISRIYTAQVIQMKWPQQFIHQRELMALAPVDR
jgi:hypothetical protein